MSLQKTENIFKGFHLTPKNEFYKFIVDIDGILTNPELKAILEKFEDSAFNSLSYEELENGGEHTGISVRVNLKARVIGFVEEPCGILHLIIFSPKHKYPTNLKELIKNYLEKNNAKIKDIKDEALKALTPADQAFVKKEAPKNATKFTVIGKKLICLSDTQKSILDNNIQKALWLVSQALAKV